MSVYPYVHKKSVQHKLTKFANMTLNMYICLYTTSCVYFVTAPYILWENPEESTFKYLTHNSFPGMAYHRDHFMAPYDGMYQVNVKVTFRGREGKYVDIN